VFQVVVLPPPDEALVLEEFRRLHDPAFHRIGPHLPILPPFEPEGTTLIERFDGFRGAGGFEVEFGPPTALGRALCLPAERGQAELRALRTALAASLLPPIAEAPDGPIVLRAGLFGSDAEIELARRAMATTGGVRPWLVREITLVLEDERGIWHAVRRRRIGG
jgi:hypothetical protein